MFDDVLSMWKGSGPEEQGSPAEDPFGLGCSASQSRMQYCGKARKGTITLWCDLSYTGTRGRGKGRRTAKPAWKLQSSVSITSVCSGHFPSNLPRWHGKTRKDTRLQ